MEEAQVPRRELGDELWGAIKEALGTTTAQALRQVLETRGAVPGDDLANLERALEGIMDLLSPRGGEILEEYALHALQLVDRDLVEP